MKFSDKTLEILKNFSTINQGIQFREGNILRTAALNKSLFAKAVLTEEFEQDACVYDLNRFLSTLGLFDSCDIELQSDRFLFKEKSRKISYTYASPEMIVSAPDKDINMPDGSIELSMKWSDMAEALKAASILQMIEVSLNSDGDSVVLSVVNTENPTADRYDSVICDNESGEEFDILIKTENLKLMPHDYDVKVSKKGIIQFSTEGLTYWVGAKAR